jgi:hypothetical protein
MAVLICAWASDLFLFHVRTEASNLPGSVRIGRQASVLVVRIIGTDRIFASPMVGGKLALGFGSLLRLFILPGLVGWSLSVRRKFASSKVFKFSCVLRM